MFIAYEVSIQLVGSLREVVPLIERGDRDLADQMRRAASRIDEAHAPRAILDRLLAILWRLTHPR